MDDQLNADHVSLEHLIRTGDVTHLCAVDPGEVADETPVLLALCEAVSGQIYRVEPFVYAVKALPEATEDVAAQLRKALGLEAKPDALRVGPVTFEAAPKASEADPQDAEAIDMALAAFEDALPDDDGAEAEMIAPPDVDAMAFEPDGVEEGAVETDPAEAPAPDRAWAGPEATPGEEALAALADRLARVEDGLGRLEAVIAGLAEAVAGQTRGIASAERLIDDLNGECRKLPERVGRHVVARTDGLVPVSQALTSVLRRLEDSAEANPSDMAPVLTGLASVQQTLADLVARPAAEAGLPSRIERRLDALSDSLGTIPERAAAQAAARAHALAPMHVALSGALFRLEHRIESLMGPAPEPGAPRREPAPEPA